MNTLNKKVTVYCDVDGVLNVKRKSVGHSAEKAFRKLPLLAGKILPKVNLWFRWQEEIIRKFSDEIIGGDTLFVWLTTWNYEAVSTVEPLTGLISHDVLEYRMRFHELKTQRRKYLLLKEHQKINPSPFIWIDDVATRSYRESDWEDSHPHLIIRPSSTFGITEKELMQITEFMKQHRN